MEFFKFIFCYITLNISVILALKQDCANENLATYTGDVSETIFGAKCVNWDDERIESKDVKILSDIRTEISRIIDVDLRTTHNYCRNPKAGKDLTPWCYHAGAFNTSNQGFQRWGYCRTKICPDAPCHPFNFENSTGDTSEITLGKFNAPISKTISGESCIPWNHPNLTAPEIEHARNELMEIDGRIDHSFCRNVLPVKNHPIPWCYTKYQIEEINHEKRWEECPVLYCLGQSGTPYSETDRTDDTVSTVHGLIIAIVICAIIVLLILIIVIAMLIRRYRRGKYPVEEIYYHHPGDRLGDARENGNDPVKEPESPDIEQSEAAIMVPDHEESSKPVEVVDMPRTTF